MNTLVKKVEALLPSLEAQGPIYLFALFERDDFPGKWDLLFSADWSDADTVLAVGTLSDALAPTLNREELSALAGVVVIRSTEPAVAELAADTKVTGAVMTMLDRNFMGVYIDRAYVFRCRAPMSAQIANQEATATGMAK